MLGNILIVSLGLIFLFMQFCPINKNYSIYSLYVINLLLINFTAFLANADKGILENYFMIVIISLMVFLISCILWTAGPQKND